MSLKLGREFEDLWKLRLSKIPVLCIIKQKTRKKTREDSENEATLSRIRGRCPFLP